ncbi:MAG: hypothetical protein Q4A00_04315 [Flavobacteriaceae bacterium]|nr:hypothetical protein [Flavobacteriaceae bacterium]
MKNLLRYLIVIFASFFIPVLIFAIIVLFIFLMTRAEGVNILMFIVGCIIYGILIIICMLSIKLTIKHSPIKIRNRIQNITKYTLFISIALYTFVGLFLVIELERERKLILGAFLSTSIKTLIVSIGIACIQFTRVFFKQKTDNIQESSSQNQK